MSLCRFGWSGSDVYVFYDVGGFINCCGCHINDGSFHADTEQEMIAHLREHQKQGHHVPEDVFEELSGAITPN
jgi:hypothetical protein